MFRITCMKSISVRSFSQSTKSFARIRRSGNFINRAETSMPAIPGYSLGAKLTAGVSAVGLGALIYNGFNLGNNVRSVDRASFWPEYVKQRIASSYMYLFQGLLVTGVSAYGFLRSPKAMSLAMRGSIPAFIATMVGMIGLQIATRSVPYENEGPNLLKHGIWAAHAAFMGFVLAPAVAMFGDVAAQAALYTAGITGGISMVGWTAPSNEYLKWAGPCAAVAGCIFIAAMASPFFNPVSGPGGALFSIVMWGGLCLAGLGVFVSTQRMISKAEHHPAPSNYYQVPAYDPINASLGIYIDMIMIFQRLLFILGSNKRK